MLAFTTLLFVSQVTAGVVGDVAQILRRDNSVEQNMVRSVESIIEPIERRQIMNVTAWDQATTLACTNALEALNGVASNPAGMAVCYNLPSLNNQTGVFEADLRLYMISPPTGDFANIASSNVQVGLAYDGATVQPVNASSLKRSPSSDSTSLISWPRAIQKRASTPTLVQAYAFVGQINPGLLATNMGTAALQNVLVPVVTLTGTSAAGVMANTTLASNEATFVNGVFANEVAPTKSQVSPPIQTLVVTDGSAFVLPGQNILIIPIGLIVTSVWTVLFVATIAYGTVGRIRFRDSYRRRVAIASKGDMLRI